jgi:AcrR family transcriptional regulator
MPDNPDRRHTPHVAMRPVLTRDAIVRAAVEVIEHDGVNALSMRRVASELGVAVMSLYNHVPNKSALLQGVAEYVIDTLELDATPDSDWKAEARALVRAFRTAAHDHPRCMTVVFTNMVEISIGLRPAERALAVATAAGFDERTGVRIMRALLAYALGAQIRDLGTAKRLDQLPDDPAGTFAALDPERFPHVVASAKEMAEYDPEADFEFGLELLISAVDALPRRQPC